MRRGLCSGRDGPPAIPGRREDVQVGDVGPWIRRVPVIRHRLPPPVAGQTARQSVCFPCSMSRVRAHLPPPPRSIVAVGRRPCSPDRRSGCEGRRHPLTRQEPKWVQLRQLDGSQLPRRAGHPGRGTSLIRNEDLRPRNVGVVDRRRHRADGQRRAQDFESSSRRRISRYGRRCRSNSSRSSTWTGPASSPAGFMCAQGTARTIRPGSRSTSRATRPPGAESGQQ
jgi:hypothetical protein